MPDSQPRALLVVSVCERSFEKILNDKLSLTHAGLIRYLVGFGAWFPAETVGMCIHPFVRSFIRPLIHLFSRVCLMLVGALRVYLHCFRGKQRKTFLPCKSSNTSRAQSPLTC